LKHRRTKGKRVTPRKAEGLLAKLNIDGEPGDERKRFRNFKGTARTKNQQRGKARIRQTKPLLKKRERKVREGPGPRKLTGDSVRCRQKRYKTCCTEYKRRRQGMRGRKKSRRCGIRGCFRGRDFGKRSSLKAMGVSVGKHGGGTRQRKRRIQKKRPSTSYRRF